MVLAPEVNFDYLIIDPFADVLGTFWLDTFHYNPRDVAIKIKRNVKDRVILFKYWITPHSFISFNKDTLHAFMQEQFNWIESTLGLDFFDLINVEVKNEKIELTGNSHIYVEFMFYFSEEKFDIAVTLLKIKGYTKRVEQVYPNSMFYSCTNLTSVVFPSSIFKP